MSMQGAKLDTAVKQLKLTEAPVTAFEEQPAVMNGQTIPSVSAWAFGGAKVGETSELLPDPVGQS